MRRFRIVVRQRAGSNPSVRATRDGGNVPIDWQTVFATYPDDVDSVIAQRIGVSTTTVWKARTNRKGKSRRDSQIFVRCPVDVRSAIIEAAAVDGVTMSQWVLKACERALDDL